MDQRRVRMVAIAMVVVLVLFVLLAAIGPLLLS